MILGKFHIYKLLSKKGSVINQKAAGESAAVAAARKSRKISNLSQSWFFIFMILKFLAP